MILVEIISTVVLLIFASIVGYLWHSGDQATALGFLAFIILDKLDSIRRAQK